MTISRKKWGKSAAKREKIVRDAVLRPDVQGEVDAYLKRARSVTHYDLAKRFNIRLSVARRYLREKESEGVVVPYIREAKFVAYTTPAELERRQTDRPVMISDVLKEIASSVPERPVITDEIDAALMEAASMTAMKPSRIVRHRRELGARKERSRDRRPQVVVEPIEGEEEEEPKEEKKKRGAPKAGARKAPARPARPAKKSAPPAEAPSAPPAQAKKTTKKRAPRIDVSEIAGVGPALKKKLSDAGYATVAKLARAKPETVAEKVSGVSEERARRLVALAQELLEQRS